MGLFILFCGFCFFFGGGRSLFPFTSLKHTLLLKEALLQMKGISTHKALCILHSWKTAKINVLESVLQKKKFFFSFLHKYKKLRVK